MGALYFWSICPYKHRPRLWSSSRFESEGLRRPTCLTSFDAARRSSLPLLVLLLKAGLQFYTEAGVPRLQGLKEKVCVFSESVQVVLGALVLPEELLGAERDVQQTGFAQDVVRVAEALPLRVTVAVVVAFLRREEIRRACLGNRECQVFGAGEKQGSCKLCQVGIG